MGFDLKKIRFEDLELSIAVLIAFFLPINPKIIVYLITLLAVLSIYGWIKRGVHKFSKSYWPFIILFGIYVTGLIFTTNFDYGLKDVETRLTFVLFPVFFGLNKRDKPLNFEWIVNGLVVGLIVKIGLCYYFAFECYETVGYVECFEGSRLSYNMHPTYLALYLLIGGAFYCIQSFKSDKSLNRKISAILVGSLFLFMVYRLFSLGPLIAFVSMITVLLFAYFYFKNQLKFFLLGIGLFAVVGFFAVQNLAFLKNDFDEVRTELSNYFEDKEQYIADNQDDPHSVNARILIWLTSVDLVKEHPFGVGTGDYKDVLLSHYRDIGMEAYADKELNSHCQYLQTALSVGIISSVFLIFTFSYYIWIGFKRKNLYLLALTALFATSCLVESVLERQWGILFFMFFLSILLSKPADKAIDH